MYVPRHFAHDVPDDLLAVMRDHAFATIVTTVGGEPFATHAPVRVERRDDGSFVVEGHVAAANPHAATLADGVRTLVIFHGPHTYVSPTLYASPARVPTWNYIVVHATGAARVVDAPADKLAILKRLIDVHEPSFNETFARFDARQRDGLLAAITGFTIVVDKLEGKFKLGQNRLGDNLPAMQATHDDGDDDRRAIAGWMRRLGHWR